jgi:16S rRNA (guanine966-N2)-methyltransferase
MRIIAGEFRGRKLSSPPGKDTRPMLDRVREALFSTLGNVIEDARVLDLFSGTGSLGLEALSRGASTVRFFERDRRALAALRENVENLGLDDACEVLATDALESAAWPEQVDVALLDPPYPMLRDLRGRKRLLEGVGALFDTHLTPGGVLVLHTHPRDLRAKDLAPREAEQRTYGRTTLWYLWKDEV